MSAHRIATLVLGALLLGVPPKTAHAQNVRLRVAIGSFESQQHCAVYTMTSGRETLSADQRAAAVASIYGYATASRSRLAWAREWRTELVRDCVDRFQGLRASLTAALAASGAITVVPPGTRGALVLSGRVSDVGTATNVTTERGNAENISEATLTVELSLADSTGRVRFGNSIVKTVRSGEQTQSGDDSSSRAQDETSTYSRLQHELAFAVARAVTFHIDPIRVISNTGQRLRVNYGAPLLTIGSTLIVDGGPSSGTIRCTVVSTGANFADVERAGGGYLGAIPLGAIATYFEPEDPGSRSPILPNVELPN